MAANMLVDHLGGPQAVTDFRRAVSTAMWWLARVWRCQVVGVA